MNTLYKSWGAWPRRILCGFCFAFLGSEWLFCANEVQDFALEPRQSQSLIKLNGLYDLQLVAAEPLIAGPIECAWDEFGRMFVADMIDDDEKPGGAKMNIKKSRIQLLYRCNKDGMFEESTTFAAGLDGVRGILPFGKGLIVCCKQGILFLKDTDGDNVADLSQPIIATFSPENDKFGVNSPRWGPDGQIYFNNGLCAITALKLPEKDPICVRGRNFKWHPIFNTLTLTSSMGQSGASFDDLGRYFYSVDDKPINLMVIENYVENYSPHNKHFQNSAVISEGIDEPQDDMKGQNSGLIGGWCGLGVYRSSLMPELHGDIFVTNPLTHSISRYKMRNKDGNFYPTILEVEKNFFQTRDLWSRPVNVVTGPDGAIYVCDLYRKDIVPPGTLTAKQDKNEPLGKGRIWRIVPKGRVLPKIEPAPKQLNKLVKWLDSDNSFERETSQRLLIEMLPNSSSRIAQALRDGIPSGVGILSWGGIVDLIEHKYPSAYQSYLREAKQSKQARAPLENSGALNSFCVRNYLHIGILRDQSGLPLTNLRRDEVLALLHVSNLYSFISAAMLAFPDDGWIQKVVIARADSGNLMYPEHFEHKSRKSVHSAALLLREYLASTDCKRTFTHNRYLTVDSLSRLIGLSNDSSLIGDALALLKNEPGMGLWWKAALIHGIAEGLNSFRTRREGATLTFRGFLSSVPMAIAPEISDAVEHCLFEIEGVISDKKTEPTLKRELMPLISSMRWDRAKNLLKELILQSDSTEGFAPILSVIMKMPSQKRSELIFEIIPLSDNIKNNALTGVLASNQQSVVDLFNKINDGALSKDLVDLETINLNRDLLRNDKASPFSTPLPSHLDGYSGVDMSNGDPRKGENLFIINCSRCHVHNQIGFSFGPSIVKTGAKPYDMLNSIFAASGTNDERYKPYKIRTRDGDIYYGPIIFENERFLTLRAPRGVDIVIDKQNILDQKPLDSTLMHRNVEATLTKAMVSDLLRYLFTN